MNSGQLCSRRPHHAYFVSLGYNALERISKSGSECLEMTSFGNDFPTHPAHRLGSGAGTSFCPGAGEWTHSSSFLDFLDMGEA